MALSAEDLILGIMDFAARSEMPVRYRRYASGIAVLGATGAHGRSRLTRSGTSYLEHGAPSCFLNQTFDD